MSRSVKITIVIGAVVVVFAAFLWFLVERTGAAREYVAGKVAAAFRQQGLIFENQSTGIALFGPAVTLNDVVIRAESAPDLPAILTAQVVKLNLDTGALLGGRVGLRDVVIESPRIDVVTTEQGRSNVPHAQPGGTRHAGIPTLRATDGSLRLDDRREGVQISLPQWRLAIQSEPRANQAGIRFQAGAPGSITVRNRKIVVSALNLDSLARTAGADIRTLDVTTQAGRFTASGSVDYASQPVFNLRGNIALLLPQLTTLAGLPQAASGELNGPFTAIGPMDRLAIQTYLNGSRIPVRGFERPVIKADAIYLRQQHRIDLRSLAVNASAAEFVANGAVGLRAAEPSSLEARINRVNLQQLTSAYASPYILASRGSGTMKANWPGLAFRQANGRADLQLTALQPAPAQKVLPASGPLSISSQNRQTQLSSTALSVLSAQWNGNVTVAPAGNLGGIVRGRTNDAGRLLSDLKAFLGRRQPLVPVGVSGAANFQADLAGDVRRPVAQLVVEAPRINIGRFDNAALTARALYNPEQLQIQQANLRWMGQTLSLKGNVGLQGGSMPLDLTAQAQGATAGALLGGGKTPEITGLLQAIPGMPQFALRMHIGGTAAQPTVTAGQTTAAD